MLGKRSPSPPLQLYSLLRHDIFQNVAASPGLFVIQSSPDSSRFFGQPVSLVASLLIADSTGTCSLVRLTHIFRFLATSHRSIFFGGMLRQLRQWAPACMGKMGHLTPLEKASKWVSMLRFIRRSNRTDARYSSVKHTLTLKDWIDSRIEQITEYTKSAAGEG